MLYFVGLGLEQSPSLKTLDILKQCERVFYESYTSPVINQQVFKEISEHLASSKIENAKREFVEDGKELLELAKKVDVALVCSGDPLVATTHQELRTRALKQRIATKIIHGSSVLCAVAGELGLHSYNFGKTVTMTSEPMQHTAYNTIFRNLLLGLHTVILLQWDESNNFFLSPQAASQSLLSSEEDIKYGIVKRDTILLIASRLGTDTSAVKIAKLGEIGAVDFGNPPHVLVFPGRFHFTEKEALSAISGLEPEYFADNSAGIERIAQSMVTRYSKKTLAALTRAREVAARSDLNIKFEQIFENVECYTDDAKRFLNEGKEELAVLSIGYAEGLLDSLRFGGQLEFEW